MTKGYEVRKAANARYLARFDEIRIRLPKGFKETVAARAAALGMSVNAYTIKLFRRDMGLSEAEQENTDTDA